MKRQSLSVFRDPEQNGQLRLAEIGKMDEDELVEGRLESESGGQYFVKNGIVDFTHPAMLLGNDAEIAEKYNDYANFYDTGLNWLFESFYEDEMSTRSRMLDLLHLKHDSKVLETGAGTGRDSHLIAKRLSPEGQLHIQDISRGMLERCRTRIGKVRPSIEYLLGNASYLPYADDYFDACYHFGGLNTFTEKSKAISEMARVTKPGGRVVFGDESVPPWLVDTEFGRVLINANPLYKHAAPLDCLPACARNVNMQWVIGGVFYLISFDVGVGQPPVDLDLPIPGKGDSLRKRYEKAKEICQA